MSENKAATRDAYGKTLVELGKTNKNIVVLDADLSGSTRTAWFAKEFPERFFNAGVAEQDMIGIASGLAVAGKTVFASSFAMFATGRPWEQIRNTIVHNKLNVKVVATHAGVTVGEDGATHQALEDIAIMRAINGMNVICPADANETEAVIKTIANDTKPFYVRLSRSATPICYEGDLPKFELGKGDQLRDGKEISIIACGIMVNEALAAAEQLAEDNIDVRVINMSSISPIDEDLIIKAAKETGKIVTAEEHTVKGGLGSAVAEIVSQKHPVPMRMVGVKNSLGQSGKPQDLLEHFKLTAKDIIASIKEIL